MIGSQEIAWTVVSIAVCFGVPIVGFIVLQAKKKRVARPFLFGVVTFAVFQIATRIPLLTYVLPNMTWYILMQLDPILYGLFLAFTAGLFEEVGRFIVIRLFLKKNHRYVDGVAFGLGHSGIEAAALVGLSLIGVLSAFILINNGAFLSHYTDIVGQAYAQVLYNQYLSVSALQMALSGVERLLTIVIHIALTLIVLTGIRKNRPWLYLTAAVLAHTVVDAGAVILPSLVPISTVGLELVVAAFAVLALIYIIYSKKSYAADIAGNISEKEIKNE